MKRLGRWMLILMATLVLGIVAVSLFVMWRVDREWVEVQLSRALSRKVTIGKLQVDLFTAVGGVKVRDLAISRRVTPERSAAMGTVPENLLFLRAGEGRLRLHWLPLLRRRLEIETLVLESPLVRVVGRADGTTDLDDLLVGDPADPPLLRQVILKGLTIHGGTLFWEDLAGGSSYRVDGLMVNAGREGLNGGLRVTSAFKLTSTRMGRAAAARSVEVECRLKGPLEIGMSPGEGMGFVFEVSLPRGIVSGLHLWKRIRELPALHELLGGLDVLGENITWKNGALRLARKGNELQFSDGEVITREYSLAYGGTWNLARNTLNLQLELRFPPSLKERVRETLAARIRPMVPVFLRSLTPAPELAERILVPFQDREGRLRMSFRVTGSPAAPRVRLEKPDFVSLRRAVGDLLKEKAAQQGAGMLQRLLTPK